MNRIFVVVGLAAALAFAAGTTALAARHASRAEARLAAPAANSLSCTNPSSCDLRSCPLGGKAATRTASAQKQGAACPQQPSCTGSCPRSGASTAVAAAVTHR